ncbi:MAG: helix-turn-helix domain-containing protein [Gammaproteobacteria bacterium]|nr:helix-turn-helix domain-containing protein [Gammaproteobacteria bacterium]
MVENDSINDRDFYAVRPELVLRAAQLFGVSSSILERGAKRLHSRAVAIKAGKEVGQWGRHQQMVIAQYCEYTESRGIESLLPWQELVEHHMRYDGKEGISSRTGNKPLSTVERLSVNTTALQRLREVRGLTINEVAASSGIPPVLLEAIESGNWPDVAQSTAACVAAAMNSTVAELFSPLDLDEPHISEPTDCAVAEPISQSGELTIESAENDSTGAGRWLFGAAIIVIAASLFYALWPDTLPLKKSPLQSETIVGTQWRTTIVLDNKNIPLPEETEELFANGGYLEFQQDGVIAFNWVDPNALVALPSTFFWRLDDSELTVQLNDARYVFPADNDDTLSTLDATRSFIMTIERIGRTKDQAQVGGSSAGDEQD